MKIKIMLLTLLILVQVISNVAFAADDWIIIVNSVSGQPDANVEIVISIDNTNNFSGMQFKFKYNPNIFEEVKEQDVAISQEFNEIANTKDIYLEKPGQINFLFKTYKEVDVNNRKDIAKIKLKVKHEVISGNYDYFIDNVFILDKSLYTNGIQIASQRGTISISNSEVTNTPTPTIAPTATPTQTPSSSPSTNSKKDGNIKVLDLINESNNALLEVAKIANPDIFIKLNTVGLIETSIQDASLIEIKSSIEESNRVVYKVLDEDLIKSLEKVNLINKGIENNINNINIKDKIVNAILIRTSASEKQEKKLILPAKKMNELFLNGIGKVIIDTGDIKIELDKNSLIGILNDNSKEVSLAISSSLTGDEAYYEFHLSSDDGILENLNNKNKYFGSVKINKSREDVEKLVLFHEDAAGKLQPLINCYYSSDTGYYNFSTSQFGKFILKSSTTSFNDTSSVKWAEKYIDALSSRMIISGVGNNEFKPNSNVTREQFAKMLVEAFELLDEEATTNLDDANKDAWFYKYVATAEKLGIVKGIGNNKFGIGSNITRQDMAVMALRAATIKGKRIKAIKQDQEFKDEGLIADYAKESVSYMQRADIINGIAEGEFAPHLNATRAQATKIIYLLYAQ
jgi:hypothetical protein